MVSWLVPIALILLIILFFRAKHIQHKIYSILIIALVIFFYTTGASIVEENNINLMSFEGIVSAGKLYFKWLGHVFENGKTIAANVLKMDWIGEL